MNWSVVAALILQEAIHWIFSGFCHSHMHTVYRLLLLLFLLLLLLLILAVSALVGNLSLTFSVPQRCTVQLSAVHCSAMNTTCAWCLFTRHTYFTSPVHQLITS